MGSDADEFGAVRAASVHLASDRFAPRRAREWLGWLGQHLSSDRCDAARLIVSELVSNAVMHSGIDEGAPIHLTGRVEGRRVWICVCDSGSGFVPAWPPPMPEPGVSGGRGLWIVHQLADHVLVDGAKGKVTFELRQGS